jgi:type I restriction enzyme S subunit
MDTKALRQKILDLAIRGKLVPQDPNDEPASVLLERIREQKKQMVKDGKLKAKDIKNDTVIFVGEDNLHYEKFADGSVKCIEDEIPFELPEGWAWCRFMSITLNRDSERKPISSANRINVDKVYDYYGASGKIDKIDKFIFNEKLLLIGEDGANLVTRSKPIAFFAEGKYWVNNHAHCIDSTDKFILKYLCLYINALSLEKYVTGSAQPKMTQDNMNSILIALPPYEEQKRLAYQINQILNTVTIIEKEKEDVVNYIAATKSKILDLAIRGQLVPQDPNDEPASVLLERIRAEKEELIKAGKIKRDKKESVIFKGEDNSYYEKIGNTIKNIDEEIPFTIPDDWIWCRLKTICKKIVDGSHNPPKGLDSVTPYIMASSRNITENTVSDLNNVRYLDKEDFIREHSRTNVGINDILLTTVATLGRSCVYKGIPENLCFQRSVTVITSCILPTYLKLFFDAPYFQDFIVNNATGTAQKGFYLNQLEEVLICISPFAEQDRISCGISSIFDNLDLIEKSLS